MGENSKEAVQKKNYFKGLKAEFKKIIWPDKKDLAKETAVVAAASIVLGIVIVVVDMVLKAGVNFLVNL